jgi:uncharacterized SAM-binding protein YcdF (DUF218 family)
MQTLSHIIWTLVQPGHLLLLALVAGWVLAMFAGTRRVGLCLGGAAIAVLVLLALFPVGNALLRPLENQFTVPNLPDRVDGILVLGGGQNMEVTRSRGRVTLNGSSERLIEAVGLALRFPEAQIVFSGGNVTAGLTGADVTRQMFAELGLDPESVVFEDRADNTYDNAVLTYRDASPMPGETWLLVTSAWHMPRSVAVFRKAGWNVIPYPVDFHTTPSGNGLFGIGLSGNLESLTLAMHEYIGLLAYRLMGRTDELFPQAVLPADQL